MKLLLSLVLLFSLHTLNAQLSKSKITKNIHAWQTENAEKYVLKLQGTEVVTAITRYHPERPEEKNDLIEVTYKGMKIQLKFTKPLKETSTHSDSLQKYFSYVSFSKIYNNIPSNGWNVHPQTPSSSLRGKGVTFTSENGTLSISIHWSIYAITGYKDSKKCNEALAMADSSAPEECFVHVAKTLPLEVLITKVSLEN
ncbi:hypothetical protein H2O64_00560 [Kordia sp. YSTF-M3]|uniref:Uncharacterized protein n=1 Tax=Kordia aestuariivivens TaxID=2759037 RepID=A0ABR7Q3Q1_9FLAO|nr:hypothetical protein [Kordia aestuariivivens]MBC8753142.1 hypothetical protein [Kordia aestuariivivens]